MPNTSLPVPPPPGAGNIMTDIATAWGEINRMSRDTGWRDITSSLRSGWTADLVRIRRVDYHVVCEITNLSLSGSTAATMIQFGTGTAPSMNFLPEGDRFRIGNFASANAGWEVGFYGVSGTLSGSVFVDGGNASTGLHKLLLAWDTWRPWPTSLPPEG